MIIQSRYRSTKEKLAYFQGKITTIRKSTVGHFNLSLSMLLIVIVGNTFFSYYPLLLVGIVEQVFGIYTWLTFVYFIWSVGRSSSQPMGSRDLDTLFDELYEVLDDAYPEDKTSNSYTKHLEKQSLLTNVDGSMLK